MADKIIDGGPAFPVAEDHQTADQFPWTAGMTLRDWFAGQAMAGLVESTMTFQDFASEAYKCADAMLAERAKTNGGA